MIIHPTIDHVCYKIRANEEACEVRKFLFILLMHTKCAIDMHTSHTYIYAPHSNQLCRYAN